MGIATFKYKKPSMLKRLTLYFSVIFFVLLGLSCAGIQIYLAISN